MDIEPLEQLLKLGEQSFDFASTAADTVAKVKGLLGASKTATDPEVTMALADLSNALADAKMANADLKTTIAKLLQAQLEAQQRDDIFARYELVTIRDGVTVWALQDEHAGDQPPHFICPHCKEDGFVSILQEDQPKRCNRCKSTYWFRPQAPRTVVV